MKRRGKTGGGGSKDWIERMGGGIGQHTASSPLGCLVAVDHSSLPSLAPSSSVITQSPQAVGFQSALTPAEGRPVTAAPLP